MTTGRVLLINTHDYVTVITYFYPYFVTLFILETDYDF